MGRAVGQTYVWLGGERGTMGPVPALESWNWNGNT
jgi:hypothetical protein